MRLHLPANILLIFVTFQLAIAKTQVKSARDLKSALTKAKPGDVIELAAGTYKGKFKANVNGTKEMPITVKGTRAAILDAGNTKSGSAFLLKDSNYWKLDGFTLKNGKTGLMLEGSNFCVINNVEVAHTGAEGVHFRLSSSDNVLQNSLISDTGVESPGFGEGVYIGSNKDKWRKKQRDSCDRNQIINNKIGPEVRAENIDIKEGTENGIIKGNVFDGSGLTKKHLDKSWISLKGNGYNVTNNTGRNTIENGFEVQTVMSGWGYGNVFDENVLDVTGATGYGIYVQKKKANNLPANLVYSSNKVIDGKRGLSNIKPTPKKAVVNIKVTPPKKEKGTGKSFHPQLPLFLKPKI